MSKVLEMFGVLDDSDVDWLIGAGSVRSVARGEVLVKQDQPNDQLYLLLQGRLVVQRDSKKIGELGAGEIIGELSFLDSRPPFASVVGLEDSVVLTLPNSRVHARLRTNIPFAARFFRALGNFMADRIRATYDPTADLAPEFLDNMTIAAGRFDRVLHKVLR